MSSVRPTPASRAARVIDTDGTSSNTVRMSSTEASASAPPKSTADAFSARASSSAPCTIAVTSRASVRCASRAAGASATARSRPSMTARSSHVKNFRYFTTSRSSVFSQNW